MVLGTNDEPVDQDAVRGLLAQAPGVRSIWIGPFWTSAHDHEYAAAAPEFSSGHSLAAGLPFPNSGSHLNAARYAILAGRLVSEVAARTRGPLGPVLFGLSAAAALVLALAVSLDRGRKSVYERTWHPGDRGPFGRRTR